MIYQASLDQHLLSVCALCAINETCFSLFCWCIQASIMHKDFLSVIHYIEFAEVHIITESGMHSLF